MVTWLLYSLIIFIFDALFVFFFSILGMVCIIILLWFGIAYSFALVDLPKQCSRIYTLRNFKTIRTFIRHRPEFSSAFDLHLQIKSRSISCWSLFAIFHMIFRCAHDKKKNTAQNIHNTSLCLIYIFLSDLQHWLIWKAKQQNILLLEQLTRYGCNLQINKCIFNYYYIYARLNRRQCNKHRPFDYVLIHCA